MKKITKKGVLSSLLGLGLLLPGVTAHAENVYKTYTCNNGTSGYKYCTNSTHFTIPGGGPDFVFSQISTLYLYSSYFTYEVIENQFYVNSGHPYLSWQWADVTTATSMGGTKSYDAYHGELLEDYTSFVSDGGSFKSTYQTSGSNIGYGGQLTTQVVSDLASAAYNQEKVINMITYPRK